MMILFYKNLRQLLGPAHVQKGHLIYRVVLVLLLFSSGCSFGASGDEHSNFHLNIEGNITPPISIPLSADEIIHETDRILDKTTEDLLLILNVPEENRDENNTLIALDKSLTYMDAHLKKYQYLSFLYADSLPAMAARDASLRQKEYINNLSKNQTLFQIIRSVIPETEYGADLRERQLAYFRQYGVEESPEQQDELVSLYSELGLLQDHYLDNIRDDRPLSENLIIIQRLAVVRERIALSAGYANYSEMQNDRYNAGGQKEWQDQVSVLRDLGQSIMQPVREELLLVKRQTNPDAADLFDYEVTALLNQYATDQYGIPHISKFPRGQTIRRSLEIISCLLGFKTERISDAVVYAPGVELYRVSDAYTGNITGWFYLDLSSRPGKISQWMTITLYPGLALHYDCANGGDTPVYLVSGAIKPHTYPYWIDAEDLTLLFHELGHLYSRLSLTTGEGGFTQGMIPAQLTETPSLLFEYLLWTPEMIGALSEPAALSVKKTGFELLGGVLTSHSPGSLSKRWGLAHQIVLSLLDSRIASSSEEFRFGEEYTEYYETITGITATDQGGYLLRHPHFGSSYSGLYWMYPVGELSAIRLYTRFLRDGVMNRTTWTDLKDLVFSSEYSTDAEERVRVFSGTEPDESNHWYPEVEFSSGNQDWKMISGCN